MMSTPGKILLAVALAYAGLAVASLIGGFHRRGHRRGPSTQSVAYSLACVVASQDNFRTDASTRVYRLEQTGKQRRQLKQVVVSSAETPRLSTPWYSAEYIIPM